LGERRRVDWSNTCGHVVVIVALGRVGWIVSAEIVRRLDSNHRVVVHVELLDVALEDGVVVEAVASEVDDTLGRDLAWLGIADQTADIDHFAINEELGDGFVLARAEVDAPGDLVPLAVVKRHLPLRIVSSGARELVVHAVAVDETRIVVDFNCELGQSGLVHQRKEAHWRTSSLLFLDPNGRQNGELEREAIGPKYSVRRNADLSLALDLIGKSIRVVVILATIVFS